MDENGYDSDDLSLTSARVIPVPVRKRKKGSESVGGGTKKSLTKDSGQKHSNSTRTETPTRKKGGPQPQREVSHTLPEPPPLPALPSTPSSGGPSPKGKIKKKTVDSKRKRVEPSTCLTSNTKKRSKTSSVPNYPVRPDEALLRKRLVLPVLSNDDLDDKALRLLSTKKIPEQGLSISSKSKEMKKPVIQSKRKNVMREESPSLTGGGRESEKIKQPKKLPVKRKKEKTLQKGTREGQVLPVHTKLQVKDFVRESPAGTSGTTCYPEASSLHNLGADNVGDEVPPGIDIASPMTSRDIEMQDVLISEKKGYLICPSESLSAESKSRFDKDPSSLDRNRSGSGTSGSDHYFQTVDENESLPLAVRTFYAPPTLPDFSFHSPILGNDHEEVMFQGDEVSPTIHLSDGEVMNIVNRGDVEGSTTRVSDGDIERGVFAGTMGSGQSVGAVREAIDDILEEAECHAEKERGGDEFQMLNSMDESIELAADATLGSFPSRNPSSSLETDATAVFGQAVGVAQQYLYKIRHTATELMKLMERPQFDVNYGMSRTKLGDRSRFFANVSVRPRRVEEAFMREPRLELYEKACGEGEACVGQSIKGGFTLVAFPSPSDCVYFEEHGNYPKNMKGGQCVLCARAVLFLLYARIESTCRAYRYETETQRTDVGGQMEGGSLSSMCQSDTPQHSKSSRPTSKDSGKVDIIGLSDDEKEESLDPGSAESIPTSNADHPVSWETGDDDYAQPLMLCNYTNLVGPGEYCLSSCITAASSGYYMGFPGCFPIFSVDMFTVVKSEGTKWIIQLYPKPEEVDTSVHDTTPLLTRSFPSPSGFSIPPPSLSLSLFFTFFPLYLVRSFFRRDNGKAESAIRSFLSPASLSSFKSVNGNHATAGWGPNKYYEVFRRLDELHFRQEGAFCGFFSGNCNVSRARNYTKYLENKTSQRQYQAGNFANFYGRAARAKSRNQPPRKYVCPPPLPDRIGGGEKRELKDMDDDEVERTEKRRSNGRKRKAVGIAEIIDIEESDEQEVFVATMFSEDEIRNYVLREEGKGGVSARQDQKESCTTRLEPQKTIVSSARKIIPKDLRESPSIPEVGGRERSSAFNTSSLGSTLHDGGLPRVDPFFHPITNSLLKRSDELPFGVIKKLILGNLEDREEEGGDMEYSKEIRNYIQNDVDATLRRSFFPHWLDQVSDTLNFLAVYAYLDSFEGNYEAFIDSISKWSPCHPFPRPDIFRKMSETSGDKTTYKDLSANLLLDLREDRGYRYWLSMIARVDWLDKIRRVFLPCHKNNDSLLPMDVSRAVILSGESTPLVGTDVMGMKCPLSVVISDEELNARYMKKDDVSAKRSGEEDVVVIGVKKKKTHAKNKASTHLVDYYDSLTIQKNVLREVNSGFVTGSKSSTGFQQCDMALVDYLCFRPLELLPSLPTSSNSSSNSSAPSSIDDTGVRGRRGGRRRRGRGRKVGNERNEKMDEGRGGGGRGRGRRGGTKPLPMNEAVDKIKKQYVASMLLRNNDRMPNGSFVHHVIPASVKLIELRYQERPLPFGNGSKEGEEDDLEIRNAKRLARSIRIKTLQCKMYQQLSLAIVNAQDMFQLFFLHVDETGIHWNAGTNVVDPHLLPGIWGIMHVGELPHLSMMQARLSFWNKNMHNMSETQQSSVKSGQNKSGNKKWLSNGDGSERIDSQWGCKKEGSGANGLAPHVDDIFDKTDYIPLDISALDINPTNSNMEKIHIKGSIIVQDDETSRSSGVIELSVNRFLKITKQIMDTRVISKETGSSATMIIESSGGPSMRKFIGGVKNPRRRGGKRKKKGRKVTEIHQSRGNGRGGMPAPNDQSFRSGPVDGGGDDVSNSKAKVHDELDSRRGCDDLISCLELLFNKGLFHPSGMREIDRYVVEMMNIPSSQSWCNVAKVPLNIAMEHSNGIVSPDPSIQPSSTDANTSTSRGTEFNRGDKGDREKQEEDDGISFAELINDVFGSTVGGEDDRVLEDEVDEILKQKKDEKDMTPEMEAVAREDIRKHLFVYYLFSTSKVRPLGRRLLLCLNRILLVSFVGLYEHCGITLSFQARRELYRWLLYDIPSVNEMKIWFLEHKHSFIYALRENHIFTLTSLIGLEDVFIELYDFANMRKNVISSMNITRQGFQRDIDQVDRNIRLYMGGEDAMALLTSEYLSLLSNLRNKCPENELVQLEEKSMYQHGITERFVLYQRHQENLLSRYLSRKKFHSRFLFLTDSGTRLVQFFSFLMTPGPDIPLVEDNLSSLPSLTDDEIDDETSVFLKESERQVLLHNYLLGFVNFFFFCFVSDPALKKEFLDSHLPPLPSPRRLENTTIDIRRRLCMEEILKNIILQHICTLDIHTWDSKDSYSRRSWMRRSLSSIIKNDGNLVLDCKIKHVSSTKHFDNVKRLAMNGTYVDLYEMMKNASPVMKKRCLNLSVLLSITQAAVFSMKMLLSLQAESSGSTNVETHATFYCKDHSQQSIQNWDESRSLLHNAVACGCSCLFNKIKNLVQKFARVWVCSHLLPGSPSVSKKKNYCLWLVGPETFCEDAYIACLVYSYRPRITSFAEEMMISCSKVSNYMNSQLAIEGKMNVRPARAKEIISRFNVNKEIYSHRKKEIRCIIRRTFQEWGHRREIDIFWMVSAFLIKMTTVLRLEQACNSMMSEINHRDPHNAAVYIAQHCPYDFFVIADFYREKHRFYSICEYPLDIASTKLQIQNAHKIYNYVPVGEPLPEIVTTHYYCLKHMNFCAHLVGAQHWKTGYINTHSIGPNRLAFDPINDERYCAFQMARGSKRQLQHFSKKAVAVVNDITRAALRSIEPAMEENDVFRESSGKTGTGSSNMEDCGLESDSSSSSEGEEPGDESSGDESPSSVSGMEKGCPLRVDDGEEECIQESASIVPPLNPLPVTRNRHGIAKKSCIGRRVEKVNMLGVVVSLGKTSFVLCPYCVHLMKYVKSTWTEIGLWCGACLNGQKAMAKKYGMVWDEENKRPLDYVFPRFIGPYPLFWNPIDFGCIICDLKGTEAHPLSFCLLFNDLCHPIDVRNESFTNWSQCYTNSTSNDVFEVGSSSLPHSSQAVLNDPRPSFRKHSLHNSLVTSTPFVGKLGYYPLCRKHSRPFVSMTPKTMRISNLMYLHYRITSAFAYYDELMMKGLDPRHTLGSWGGLTILDCMDSTALVYDSTCRKRRKLEKDIRETQGDSNMQEYLQTISECDPLFKHPSTSKFRIPYTKKGDLDEDIFFQNESDDMMTIH